jgi:hypothetical protein
MPSLTPSLTFCALWEKSSVHRQLDDVPVVSLTGTNETERFTEQYKDVCKKLSPTVKNTEKLSDRQHLE